MVKSTITHTEIELPSDGTYEYNNESLKDIVYYDDEMLKKSTKSDYYVPFKMDFGGALRALKSGYLVARFGWSGRGMAIAYQPGYPDGVPTNKNTAAAWHIKEGTLFRQQPYLQIRCVDGTYQMYNPSQTDVLAEDWYVVD